MKHATGILLAFLGTLLLLWGSFCVIAAAIGLLSSVGSAYSTGVLIGRIFAGVIFLLLGWKAFKSGRRRMFAEL